MGAGNLAHASDDPVYGDEARYWFYVGGNAGYSILDTSNSISEGSKSGSYFAGRLLLSGVWDSWVVDAGIGSFWSSLSNNDVGSVNVSTNALFAELSPRYRLTRRWQLGVVAQGYFATDVSFSEHSLAEQDFTLALGARVDYQFPLERWGLRVGAQAITTVGIPDRELLTFQADVQIGLPLSAPPVHSAPEPEPTPTPTPEPSPTPEPVAAAPVIKVDEIKQELRIIIGDHLLHFNTGMSKLAANDRQAIARFSKYIMSHKDLWKHLNVEGHSDKRGGAALNARLSARRAKVVADAVIAGGVPKSRVSSKGYGPARPVDLADTPEAYAKNRRVEIVLTHVSSAATMVSEIGDLLQDLK